MKKLLAILIILWAIPASAQETYDFSVTAGQITNVVNPARVTFNEQNCAAANLVLTCTEVQLQAVAGFGSARIYADTQAGRDEWFEDVVITPLIPQFKSATKQWDLARAKVDWNDKSRANKDIECVHAGRAAGCELF